jgi:hypothetical protein
MSICFLATRESCHLLSPFSSGQFRAVHSGSLIPSINVSPLPCTVAHLPAGAPVCPPSRSAAAAQLPIRVTTQALGPFRIPRGTQGLAWLPHPDPERDDPCSPPPQGRSRSRPVPPRSFRGGPVPGSVPAAVTSRNGDGPCSAALAIRSGWRNTDWWICGQPRTRVSAVHSCGLGAGVCERGWRRVSRAGDGAEGGRCDR